MWVTDDARQVGMRPVVVVRVSDVVATLTSGHASVAEAPESLHHPHCPCGIGNNGSRRSYLPRPRDCWPTERLLPVPIVAVHVVTSIYTP